VVLGRGDDLLGGRKAVDGALERDGRRLWGAYWSAKA